MATMVSRLATGGARLTRPKPDGTMYGSPLALSV
jgi:hypothetical protein